MLQINSTSNTKKRDDRRHALIIGGGIGGLTTAIALRQNNIRTTILEQARELREAGAGLVLWSNATAALQQLGCQDIIQSVGIPITSLDFFSPRGQLLSTQPLDTIAQKLGTPSLAVHRADLQAALVQLVGKEQIHLQSRCERIEQQEQQVVVHLAQGQTMSGSLLIGADGLRSVIRDQLFHSPSPRYAGYTLVQGVVDFEHPFLQTGRLSQTWGNGIQFGSTRLTRGRVYWFLKIYTAQGHSPFSKQDILTLCSGWHEPIEDIIRTTDDSVLVQHDIFDLPPLPHWTNGNVTLLGDAAHPMTTHQSQGACQAIEDALMLRQCLQLETDIPTALRQYEECRIKRASSIVTLSHNVGWTTRWKNPLLANFRNVLLKSVLAPLQQKSMEVTIGHQIEELPASTETILQLFTTE